MSSDTESETVRIDDWLQPDAVLPVQFHAESGVRRDPEHRLRLAVLKDAIRYCREYVDSSDRRERALYEDAVDWIESPDRSEPFAFENVCDAIGLDADYLRERLCRRHLRAA
ncbi:MAG TPA: hypothetical protein VGK30_06215 [Candidatus Binatia bacterium]|jgi:hypothetical protein